MNLYSFVENPFTDKAFFNYDKFKDVVYKAQRLMDDIVDLEEEKINLILNKIENDPEPEEIKSVEKNLWLKIRERLLEGRRTGVSAIGLSDSYAALSIGYGSDISITLAEEIYKQFAISAYKSSIDMAKERGAFPVWNIEKEKNNPFLNRILGGSTSVGDDMWLQHLTYGRRNIALLTIPPSGTISMMAGISSGIEPVYQLYYKRRYKILENTEEKKQYDFIDQNGDKWKEYIVYHPKFVEWSYYYTETNPSKALLSVDELVKESPYYKSTSYEIDPIQRVKLQGAIQKWIDHSISSTINLPETVSEAEVSDIYFAAWKEGLKGVTIYRNNCRTGVLVDINKQENIKRPKIVKCNIHNTKIQGNNYMVLVGIQDNKPYEIFVKSYPFEKSVVLDNVGEILKLKSKDYLLRTKNTEVNLTQDLPNDQALLTRLISTMLKKDINIEEIMEQVEKADGDLTSFGKAVCRILKRYIKDGTHSIDTCPECGSKMIYQNGCKECSKENNAECTFSKCG